MLTAAIPAHLAEIGLTYAALAAPLGWLTLLVIDAFCLARVEARRRQLALCAITALCGAAAMVFAESSRDVTIHPIALAAALAFGLLAPELVVIERWAPRRPRWVLFESVAAAVVITAVLCFGLSRPPLL